MTINRNGDKYSLLGEKFQNKTPHSASKTMTTIKTMDTSTRNESPDSLLGEKSQVNSKTSINSIKHNTSSIKINVNAPSAEASDPSWSEAAQKKLLESELTSKMHKKSA